MLRVSNIFIINTKYCHRQLFQTEQEMKQLLDSLNRINLAQRRGERHFESHIFFDGGVRDTVLSEFALQLISLLKSSLGTSM